LPPQKKLLGQFRHDQVELAAGSEPWHTWGHCPESRELGKDERAPSARVDPVYLAMQRTTTEAAIAAPMVEHDRLTDAGAAPRLRPRTLEEFRQGRV
jgi:hypothetical protein